VATIHHGIDTDAFAVTPSPEGYLAFFGRLHPDKGVVAAIDTAEKVGLPLKIAGIIQDQEYFDTLVRRASMASGAVRRALLRRSGAFLGGAVALLHLIGFDEPFLVVEAMACAPRSSPSLGAPWPSSSTRVPPVPWCAIGRGGRRRGRVAAFDRSAIRPER